MLNKVFRAALGALGMLFGYGVSVLLLQEGLLDQWITFTHGQVIFATVCSIILFGIIFFNLFEY